MLTRSIPSPGWPMLGLAAQEMSSNFRREAPIQFSYRPESD